MADLPVPQIIERLEACCVCVGYLEDSARFEFKDQVQPEVKSLVALLRVRDPQAESTLTTLARTHSKAWVRYHVAASIWRQHPAVAKEVFAELRQHEGLVAAAASLGLAQLQKE